MKRKIRKNECCSFIITFKSEEVFDEFINNARQMLIKLETGLKYNSGPIMCDYGLLGINDEFYDEIFIHHTSPSIAVCCKNKIDGKDLLIKQNLKEIFINHNKELLDSLL